MGILDFFNKTKKNNREGTWVVYQDMLEDKKLSVRVDTQYISKDYKNTFYIQLKYSEKVVNDLPNREFLDNVSNLEEKVIESCNKTFQENVVFLGTATFGGSSYITFASNLDIKWEDYIKTVIDENLIAGTYPNDNMGYYNQVLYPEYLRKQ